jgi:hypothetical protein
LERWLEHQITFTDQHERRVMAIILAKLATLLGMEFPDIRALRQYRRDLARQLQAA